MYDTPEEVLAAIKEAGFPPIFENIWTRQIPLSLRGTCERPIKFFRIKRDLETFFPKAKTCLPLWETNQESIVAFDKDEVQYFKYYYGDTESQFMGASYQQFVSYLFIELAHSGVVEELRDLASIFFYKHTDSLIAFVRNTSNGDPQEFKRQFVSRISD